MAKNKMSAVDTWDLTEILAVLSEVARNAGDAVSPPKRPAEETQHMVRESPEPAQQ
jgi:hypothetical protein